MRLAEWCLLVVALLPFPWVALAKSDKRFNNNAPRAWLGRQEGWRARALAAHQNSWEALGLFTAALVVAWHTGAPDARIDQLALAFVVTRVLHGILYIANWAPLRSLVWFIGMICIVWLFVAGVK